MSDTTQFHGNDLQVEIGPPKPSQIDGHRSSEKSSQSKAQRKSHPTILVADDDHRLADALAAGLQDNGFETLTAYDGNVALAIAITKNPDLIVLDSRMPKRSGYLVLEYLRTTENLSTPVVMLSENEGKRHQRYAWMLGAVEFIEKPIEPERLVALVAKLMRHIYV